MTEKNEPAREEYRASAHKLRKIQELLYAENRTVKDLIARAPLSESGHVDGRVVVQQSLDGAYDLIANAIRRLNRAQLGDKDWMAD